MFKSDKVHIRELVSTALTLLLCVAIGFILATVFTFVFQINDYFWTITLVGIAVMIITNRIWLPTGIEKGLAEKKIINNTKIYNNRADYIATNQKFMELEAFCKYKNEKQKKDLIIDILAKVTLDYWVYEKYIDSKSQDDNFKSYITKLSVKQIKTLERLKTKEVKFEKLTPKQITIGKSATKGIVPHNKEGMYRNILLIGKIIWGIVLGCFMAFIIISPTEFGIAQVVQCAVWFFSIIYNVWASIYSGKKSITVYRNNYMIEQAELCAEFFSYIKIPMNEVDKEVTEEQPVNKQV